MNLIVSGAARNHWAESEEWYEAQQLGLGLAFSDAVRAGLERVRKNPELFPRTINRLRKLQLDGFPYLVYYRNHSDTIEIVALLHAKRHQRNALKDIR